MLTCPWICNATATGYILTTQYSPTSADRHAKEASMIAVRPANERGHFQMDWLDSWHSFSFGHYYDPRHMGFRALRVINDDRIAPEGGFPTHGHSDMEIVTYLLDGAIAHKDSLGTGSVIRPGEVQRMTAGTGIRHSEFNPSSTEGTRLLQIWLLPERNGLKPSYEQTAFPAEELKGRLRLVASPEGADGSVTIHTYAKLYAGMIGAGDKVEHSFAQGRHGWLQVARGEVDLAGRTLREGDGVAFSEEPGLVLTGRAPGAEVLLFDLA
jgi:redox-sensitive bicupin YhaK (pirin superfamily)